QCHASKAAPQRSSGGDPSSRGGVDRSRRRALRARKGRSQSRMTNLSEPWIETPHLRPDHRGPTDRAYVPFKDPTDSPPMVAMLEDVAIRSPEAIAVESLDERLTYRGLWQAVCRLRSGIEAVDAPDTPVAILLPIGAAY